MTLVSLLRKFNFTLLLERESQIPFWKYIRTLFVRIRILIILENFLLQYARKEILHHWTVFVILHCLQFVLILKSHHLLSYFTKLKLIALMRKDTSVTVFFTSYIYVVTK